MKPHSLDLRERVVSAIEKGDSSFRKVAQRYAVSKTCVERWVKMKRTTSLYSSPQTGWVSQCRDGT
jgi:transposase